MKITVINGQNHKGSTYNIGKMLLDNISCEKNVSEFFLPKDLNCFCAGCYTCIEDETKCPYYKEKNVILREIEQSDLLVFTTPNYCMAPSAPMKAFMDLSFTYWLSHKPRECMFNKRAVVISSTAGMGAKQAIKPVARALFYWGVPWIKSYGISVQAMNWNGVLQKKKAKIEKDMKSFAKTLSKSTTPSVSIKTKLMFIMMANMQKSNLGSSPTEKKYWEEHGWLGKERPWKRQ
ncbi:flavodoxin family protein [Ethanoligenens sp.]|uniref:flavodoxin family protein n=1 Tax=Ethanoligenens sp. TaxID=2099655 RepID=UPI0039E7D6AA